jgi:hypothetical protein
MRMEKRRVGKGRGKGHQGLAFGQLTISHRPGKSRSGCGLHIFAATAMGHKVAAVFCVVLNSGSSRAITDSARASRASGAQQLCLQSSSAVYSWEERKHSGE